jgi:hypothetical protein
LQKERSMSTTKDPKTTDTTDTVTYTVPRVYPSAAVAGRAGRPLGEDGSAWVPVYHMGPLTGNPGDRVRMGDSQVYGTRGFIGQPRRRGKK